MTPEIFSQGIVSTGLNEIGSSFSSDGKEFFFSVGSDLFMSIITMKEENEGWSEPEVASFSGYYDDFDAKFSPDGNWTEMKNMGEKINSVELEHSAWISPDGKHLFFTSNRKNNFTKPMTYGQYSASIYKPRNAKNDIYWVDAKIIEELRPKE